MMHLAVVLLVACTPFRVGHRSTVSIRGLCDHVLWQEGIFSDASQLQNSCLLIAQNLLPAERMATELSDMDTETTKMEAQVEVARATLQRAQEALRTNPSDVGKVYERDVARGAYMESLTALKAQYEERQSRGNRYAAASEKVAAAVGSSEALAEPSDVEERDLVDALNTALPVLKTVIRDIGDANRKTIEAMDALAAAMSRELSLIEQIRGPLLQAKKGCQAAIASGARHLLTDRPRDDLAQVALLLGDVRAREQQMERAQMLLLEANRGLSTVDETANDEVRIADELDEMQLALNKATRHGDAAEMARLQGEKEMLKASLESLHERSAMVRKVLMDPLLAESFPETKRLHELKTGAGRIIPGGVDPAERFDSYELATELSRSPGKRVVIAHPKPQGSDVLITELQIPQSDAFVETQLSVAALKSPLLLAPTKIVYDPSCTTQTYLVHEFMDYHTAGSSSLADWVMQARGRAEVLATPPPAPAGYPPAPPVLTSKLAPLFTAVSTLHRVGVLHGSISPETVRIRADGALALGWAGCRAASTMGPYDAPEVFHDPLAHQATPLAADAWSLGAILMELLTGVTPRWNQMMNYLEDAVMSRPLLPPETMPEGGLGDAWMLTLRLTERDPTKRLSVHAALQSPLFDSLRPTDALSVLLSRCRPGQLSRPPSRASETPDWLRDAEGILETGEAQASDGPGPEDEVSPPVVATQSSTALAREPLRVVLSSDSDDALLVDLTLSVASDLELEDNLVFINESNQTRPAAELLHRFFSAASSSHFGLLAAEDEGATLLPPAGAASDESKAKARTFGRLLGYAACHSIAVPLPLSAALFYFITAKDDLTDQLGRALGLLAGFDPRRARELRAQLSKRLGHKATPAGVFAFAEQDSTLSDSTKAEIAIAAVRHLLVGCRYAMLAAVREGVQSIVKGADLSALKPAELARRLLGWEPQPAGVDCHFEEDDWEDADLLAAYSGWLDSWTASLTTADRCALRMLLVGTATQQPEQSQAVASRTTVLCSAGPEVHFLPETRQLYVPMACSADEFNEQMNASLL